MVHCFTLQHCCHAAESVTLVHCVEAHISTVLSFLLVGCELLKEIKAGFRRMSCHHLLFIFFINNSD